MPSQGVRDRSPPELFATKADADERSVRRGVQTRTAPTGERMNDVAVCRMVRTSEGDSSMVSEFVVTAGELPKRLDIFLVNREPKLSRSALQRLIGQGRVRINGQVVKPSQKIKPGDTIAFDIPKAE